MYTEGAGDDIELYHSKCGSWVTSDGTAWELLRNAESWAPSSSSWIRMGILTRSLGNQCSYQGSGGTVLDNSVIAHIPPWAAQHKGDIGEGARIGVIRRELWVLVSDLPLNVHFNTHFPPITASPVCFSGLLWGPNGILANKALCDLGPDCLSDPTVYHFPFHPLCFMTVGGAHFCFRAFV